MLTDQNLPRIHIDPGGSFLVREPAILYTLLGSCVGITFWVKRLSIGALCHPMLPYVPVLHARRLDGAAGRRYVDFTVRDMAAQFDALGVKRREIEVKVFGGADVLDFAHHDCRPTVGRLNREAVARLLHTEGYAVAASSVGGNQGVQIQFNTSNGEVLLRRFAPTQKAGRAKHQPSRDQEV